jgi:hypothetical protein
VSLHILNTTVNECRFAKSIKIGGNKEEMKHKELRYIIGMLLAVLLALSLTACGSGGGGGGGSSSGSIPQPGSQPETVSGVAAIGAPLAGGNVYVKDSSGTEHGPYPIDANGNYSIDVTGFNNPPFYIRAEGVINGRPITLYSVSINPGTANVNPLTNLAIAAASGLDPADVYNNPLTHPVAQTDIDKAISDILTLLAPILNNPAYNASNSNPLTDDDYEADGTGLDGVIDDLNLYIDITHGTVIISLNGVPVGEAHFDKLDEPDDLIEEGEVANALTDSFVSGTGQTCPFPATLNLNVDVTSLETSTLRYEYQETFLEATEISSVIMLPDGSALITGTGNLNGDPNHIFIATVKDGPDKMAMQIDGISGTVSIVGPLLIIDGAGFTIEDTSISGIGQTCPFPATLNLNVSDIGEGSLSYDFEDTFFQATSINAPVIANGTATITGTGTLNGEQGHTFTVTVKDGSPDRMGMEIDGVAVPDPVAGPLHLIDGSGFTIT